MANVRIKRTYNLPEATVKSVREIADRYGASQDGVVELAVAELTRRIRAEDEQQAWTEAAADPTFRAEMERLDAEMAVASDDSWPQE